jgi:osmotically-inducible protein OsmY
MKTVFMATAALVLSSPSLSLANEAQTQKVSPNAAVTATDQGLAVKDTAITKTIRERIMKDKTLSMKAKNITIVTNAGHVILKGPVANAEERTKVEGIAKSVSGTTGLENHTEISQ